MLWNVYIDFVQLAGMKYFGRLASALCGQPYKGDADVRKQEVYPRGTDGVPAGIPHRMEDIPFIERLGKYDDILSSDFDRAISPVHSPVDEATCSALHYARQILRGCFPELVLRAALKEDRKRQTASRR